MRKPSLPSVETSLDTMTALDTTKECITMELWKEMSHIDDNGLVGLSVVPSFVIGHKTMRARSL